MGQAVLGNFGHPNFKMTQTLDIENSSLVCLMISKSKWSAKFSSLVLTLSLYSPPYQQTMAYWFYLFTGGYQGAGLFTLVFFGGCMFY